MNGYSEASIVCGGNIGDPGFYLYLAKVKQKLQKILQTDREDLLIDKVERWNSVRVTFKLPPTSADTLRSLAEQRSEALRNLGIQSVQVDAGKLVSLGAAQSANSEIEAAAHTSSTAVINWSRQHTDRVNITNASPSGSCPSSSEGSSGLIALVGAPSGDEISNGQKQLERKRSLETQQFHTGMAAKANSQMQPAASCIQQQNLLGYLLEEPDQPNPPAPPPYQDFSHQQISFVSASSPTQHQQRWQNPQQASAPTSSAWNQRTTAHALSGTAGHAMPEPYFPGHQQRAPHPAAIQNQHHQYASNVPAIHSRQLQEAGIAVGYSVPNNSNPAFHYNHQQVQANAGNVSNSPLLVGLLQQNSPPPQQSSSSSFMQPSTTPLLRNNNSVNLSGYDNELVAESSPAPWIPAASSQGPMEPAAKKLKRAAPKPKKEKPPGTGKNVTGKKAVKRAGANISSDGNATTDPSSSASSSYAPAVDHGLDNQQSTPTNSSSFNRDTSISSVIDSVLCNVAMGATAHDTVLTGPEVGTETKPRTSFETLTKATPPGPLTGMVDETSSQFSPMPAVSVPTNPQQLTNATESPVQYPQRRQQQQQQPVLRSVSSSSSCSSPLVSSSSPTFDPQWHQRPGGAGGAVGGLPPYGAYQNQPNHQFVQHPQYGQPPDADIGVGRLRRPVMMRQPPPQFSPASPIVNRFHQPGLPSTPDQSYRSPQMTHDLAHHDNASQIDNKTYSSSNKARSPGAASVNGDLYMSPHAASAAVARQQISHGQQIPQHEQYGAASVWSAGGNGNSARCETASYMISPKTTNYDLATGADHDYLIASSIESGSNASLYTSFASDQSQPSVTNQYHGAQQQDMYNYNSMRNRPAGTAYYNGGSGDGQQMQEALVARHAAVYDHQQSSTQWDKQQQQRMSRHRQWTLQSSQQQSFEQHGIGGPVALYDDEPLMRDSSTQGQIHNHGLSIQHQQQSVIDDPMLTGQVPAR